MTYRRYYTDRIAYLQSLLPQNTVQDTEMNDTDTSSSQDFVDAEERVMTTTTAAGTSFSLQEYVIPTQPRKGKREGARPEEELYQVRDAIM